MLVRTWNLFHGNADPPQRRGYLREMVELITADSPDVVCLQEVPIWALGRLARWSGMACFPAVARGRRVPDPAGRWLTSSNLGLFARLSRVRRMRSWSRRHTPRVTAARDRSVTRGASAGLHHAVSVAGLGVVANVHATNEWARPEVPRADWHRAQSFAEALTAPTDVVVIAGDFNLTEPELEGYARPGPGIDHVLVRGGSPGPVVVWERERTTVDGVVLSDHPPVERRVLQPLGRVPVSTGRRCACGCAAKYVS